MSVPRPLFLLFGCCAVKSGWREAKNNKGCGRNDVPPAAGFFRRLVGWWGQSVQFWVLEFRLCASPTFNDTLPEVDTDGKLP